MVRSVCAVSNKGKPMMPDKEFDALKLRLKEMGSEIAIAVRSVRGVAFGFSSA